VAEGKVTLVSDCVPWVPVRDGDTVATGGFVGNGRAQLVAGRTAIALP
jgi:acyl CoA:acetate/3-ketoacid CoA transferase alpha subunit